MGLHVVCIEVEHEPRSVQATAIESHTMSKDPLAPTPRKAGREPCLIRGFIVAEAHLKIDLTIDTKESDDGTKGRHTSRYIRCITSFGGRWGI